MKVTRFHHVSINTNGAPLDEMVDFYRDVFGLADRPRPEIPGVPGHWHAVGDQELHIVGAPPSGPGIDPTGHHYCVAVEDLDGAIAELDDARHRVRARRAGCGRRADLDHRPGREHRRAPASARSHGLTVAAPHARPGLRPRSRIAPAQARIASARDEDRAPDRRGTPSPREGRPRTRAPGESFGVDAGRRPARSDRAARGPEHDARAGSRAGAPRPDDGVAVHVLPGRGEDHGRRPEGHPERGPRRAALRRRAPLQLRCLRVAGAHVALRPQRLRRDAPGPVRVGREAHGGELHDRRPQQRLHAGRRPQRHAPIGGVVPPADGGVRADDHDGHLVLAPVRSRPDERHRAPRRVR